MVKMPRWWVSWWSGNYEDEGCTAPPFDVWQTGHRDRQNDTDNGRDEISFCLWVEAEDEAAIWAAIAKHYPDYEERFCNPCDDDYAPGDRFPGATLQRIEPVAEAA
jgi:hypothetical protein